jgi:multidrug efflux pump subunit AcrB
MITFTDKLTGEKLTKLNPRLARELKKINTIARNTAICYDFKAEGPRLRCYVVKELAEKYGVSVCTINAALREVTAVQDNRRRKNM